MKLEEIKEGQYLYYTERGCAPFKGSSPDHADSLFYVDWDRGEPRLYCKCGAVDGKYENQEDYLGGRLYESMWTPERWFLTDFPGGDAAEWMSRNYPLNGQAVKEEPKEPIEKHTEIHRDVGYNPGARFIIKEVEIAINEGLSQSLLEGNIPTGIWVSLRDKTLRVLVRGINREASAGDIEKAILLEMCCHKESEMLFRKAQGS